MVLKTNAATKFGMLSVKAGIDKNPNPTQADRIAGAKMKSKKTVNIMAKLCPRGKAAAKRKFKVYPSAYANMYASAVCSGKVTPGGKKKRKKAMGGGMMDMTM